MPFRHTNFIALCTWLFLAISLVGCASAPPNPGIEVTTLVLKNASSTALEKVRVKVEETGGLVGCGYILLQSECSTNFPARIYLGQALTLSWIQDGKPYSREGLTTATQDVALRKTTATLEISIKDDGEVDIYFTQPDENPMPPGLRHATPQP